MKKIILLVFLPFLGFGQNGLQGYWPFDGNALDYSGNNNNGTVHGATPCDDHLGHPNKAYYFDGVSNYIVTAFAGVTGTTSRTVTFWGRLDSNVVTSSGQVIFSYGDTPATGLGSSYRLILNRACMGIGMDVGDATTTLSDAVVGSGQWHFYSVVYDNSLSPYFEDIKIYRDGTWINQTPCNSYHEGTEVNTASSVPINFGRLYLTGSTRYFKGALDEVRIFDRALTRTELDSLYNGENLGLAHHDDVAESFRIFPVPCNDILNVELPGSLSTVEVIEVVDLTGRTLLSYPVNTFDKSVALPVSDLVAGEYLVRVGGLTRRFVKK